MTRLITGATGFIGRRAAQPDDRPLVRTLRRLPCEVQGDLADTDSLARACHKVDEVLHCAGYAHALDYQDGRTHWQVNYGGTKNLVETAGRCGVKRFIFLSSVKALAEPGGKCIDEDWPGEPATPYGRAKRAAEETVLEAGERYGMHVVVLRLAMVYGHGCRGNLERMMQAMRAGWFPPLPETGNRRSIVHVDDVVEVMHRVAVDPRAGGRTYIIAHPFAPTGRQLYDALRELLGLRPCHWEIPPWVWRTGGRAGDGLNRLLSWRPPIDQAVVDRLLGSAWYSPSRIERELGWQARVSLAEGLQEMLGK